MTVPIKKPMKGEEAIVAKLRYPLMMTPKVDGIRCMRVNGESRSASLKLIPNDHVRKVMEGLPDGLDGELILAGKPFNEISSAIMSHDGEPDFEFWVFDYMVDPKVEYHNRMKELGALALPAYCKKMLPWIANNEKELLEFEQMVIDQGYEGAMLRSANGPYKFGKSTVKEGWLLKLKRFVDSEAEIIGFEEQLENTNEQKVSETGNLKRSQHKDGMKPKNTLGKFLVREVGDMPWKGQEFAIGTGRGLTESLRKEIWDKRDQYVGQLVKYKFQEHGTHELPRLPIFLGFRNREDMS